MVDRSLRVTSSRLTVDSVVHDETTSVSDPLGLVRIASLVIVSEPDGLAASTETTYESPKPHVRQK